MDFPSTESLSLTLWITSVATGILGSGVGIIAAFVKMRVDAKQIAYLERQIEELKKKKETGEERIYTPTSEEIRDILEAATRIGRYRHGPYTTQRLDTLGKLIKFVAGVISDYHRHYHKFMKVVSYAIAGFCIGAVVGIVIKLTMTAAYRPVGSNYDTRLAVHSYANDNKN
jgi:uncharacterized membrane-anchored protein YhcB (DUF1043 family)